MQQRSAFEVTPQPLTANRTMAEVTSEGLDIISRALIIMGFSEAHREHAKVLISIYHEGKTRGWSAQYTTRQLCARLYPNEWRDSLNQIEDQKKETLERLRRRVYEKNRSFYDACRELQFYPIKTKAGVMFTRYDGAEVNQPTESEFSILDFMESVATAVRHDPNALYDESSAYDRAIRNHLYMLRQGPAMLDQYKRGEARDDEKIKEWQEHKALRMARRLRTLAIKYDVDPARVYEELDLPASRPAPAPGPISLQASAPPAQPALFSPGPELERPRLLLVADAPRSGRPARVSIIGSDQSEAIYLLTDEAARQVGDYARMLSQIPGGQVSQHDNTFHGCETGQRATPTIEPREARRTSAPMSTLTREAGEAANLAPGPEKTQVHLHFSGDSLPIETKEGSETGAPAAPALDPQPLTSPAFAGVAGGAPGGPGDTSAPRGDESGSLSARAATSQPGAFVSPFEDHKFIQDKSFRPGFGPCEICGKAYNNNPGHFVGDDSSGFFEDEELNGPPAPDPQPGARLETDNNQTEIWAPALDWLGLPHHCHAIGCLVEVEPRLLMCAPHWRQVPAYLKAQVWSEYRTGQELDKRPSAAYLKVAREAVAAVARLQGGGDES